MNTPENNVPKKENISVPRDRDLDNPAKGENIPPEGALTQDEDYADDQRGLTPDSPLVDALHKNRPSAEGQLTTGSGGDAARPGKEGIFGKPIPPRGKL
jgi:hypothetical protein